MSVCLHRETECASKTEICQFNVPLVVNEQVLRLEISVHHSMGVAVGSAHQNLIDKGLNLLWRKRASYLPHVLLKVIVAILKYKI